MLRTLVSDYVLEFCLAGSVGMWGFLSDRMLVVVVGIHIPKCLPGGGSMTVSRFVSSGWRGPGWCVVVHLMVWEGMGGLLGCWLGRGSGLSLCGARGLGCLHCHSGLMG